MSNSKFITILDRIGESIKWFFTNPIAANMENTGITIAEIAAPGLTPLLTGIQTSLTVAHSLAKTAAPGTDTASQVAAVILADTQQVFAAYTASTGTQIETAQQKAIINAFIALLNEIPGATVTK